VIISKYFEGVIFEYGIPFLNCCSLLLFSVGAIHGFFIGCRVGDKGYFEVILQEISSIDMCNQGEQCLSRARRITPSSVSIADRFSILISSSLANEIS
jgi:hypothetical protein